MGTSGRHEWIPFAPSPLQAMATTIVMKFTDYTNAANIAVGALGFSIHQAAGLSTQERADTFIKVRKRQNLVVLATYRESAAQKLLATTKLIVRGKLHTVSSYKAHDPANTRGVLHGVPSSYTRDQIRASLKIPGHRILDFRRMGESQSILITIEGPRLPREAIFCSAITRLYPPRINCRPCLHCLSLQHRTDVCPTRREFVRCSDCGTKLPPNQDPMDTPHNCELRCFNCHGDHSAIDPSCQASQAATRALRERTRSIRNRHRNRLAITSLYGDAGARPGLSPSDRCTPLDRSRSSSQVTPNSSPGEERICRRSQHTRDQFLQDRTQMTRGPTPVRKQSPSEQGRISPAATCTASGQGTSQPEMMGSGPYARGRAELRSRLKNIYEERDVIRKLLQEWIEQADAVVGQVSIASQAGFFVGPLIHGFATLDRIFKLLFQVQVYLSEEDNFTDPLECPRVSHRAITYPSPSSGAEAPAQDTNGSCLGGPPSSLNVPSAASPSVNDEAPELHPSDSAVLPPLYTSSRSATSPTAPAAHTCAAGPKTWPQLGAQPMTTDVGPTTRPAGPASDAEISSLPGAPNGTSALKRPLVCTETPAGATSTVANRTAPQSVTVAPPTCKSASGKAHGYGSTEEAAGQSDEGELSEGASGLRRYSQASQKVPNVSPKRREDAKSGGDATSSSLLLCERTNANRVSCSVKRPVSCARGPFDIPSAKLVNLGTVQKVVVSCYMTPSNFWLHLESSAGVLESMTNSLGSLCDATGPLAGFEARVGMCCAARYTVDGCWYRARIMQILLDHVQVSYVDYGNCDRVKLHDLRPLDTFHASMPAKALPCSVQSAASAGRNGAWPAAAMHQFRTALEDSEQLEARFQSRDHLTGRYVVDVLGRPAGGQAAINLSLQFLSQCAVDATTPIQAAVAPADPPPAADAPPVTSALAVAPRPEAPLVTSVAAGGAPWASVRSAGATARCLLPLQSSVPATPAAARLSVGHAVRIPPAVLPDQDSIPLVLSAVFSPTKFYAVIQMEDGSEKTLEDIQGQLVDSAMASNPPTVNEVTKGTCWICLYDGDKKWYRVRVLKDAKNDDDWRAQVLFVDVGNRSMTPVSNLRPLPAHLAALPACAHRMALAFVVPRGGGGDGHRWDEEATRFFVAHTGFRTVLTAEKRGQRQLGFETVTNVQLWNRSCEPPVNINILLLQEHRAMLRMEKKGSKKKECP